MSRLRWAGLLALGGMAVATNVSARAWHVGPGQELASPTQVAWSALAPGDVVWIHPGSYSGNMMIQGAAGTASAPIVVKAAVASDPPHLLDGMALRGSSWVTVSQMDVTVAGWADLPKPYKTWAAVIIDQGSHDVTVSQSTVHDARVGMAIVGAGLGLHVLGNQVLNNGYHGIVVNTSSGTAAQRSEISGNVIRGNGQHGLELASGFFAVEHNQVSANGAETRVAVPAGGTSGIHLYSTGSDAGCSDNIVRYNHVSGQVDRIAADGNGIHMDHFCNRNLVAYNVSWGNDGSGIGLYAAGGNIIRSNTLRANAQDTQRPVRVPGVLVGELILTSAPWINGVYTANATRDNQCYDNLIVSTQASVPAVNVDAIVTDDPNQVGPNWLWAGSAGNVVNFGGWLAKDAANADRLTHTTGHLVEVPRFADAAHPAADGLRPVAMPTSKGVRIKPRAPDLLSVMPVAGASYLGAYYVLP